MFGIRGLKAPSDTESWIVPAFLALLLPVLIDVKVVVSEGTIPLMLEADEMPEIV
jgi:CRISPR-associated protein Csc3